MEKPLVLKKLTITVDEDVCRGLHQRIDRRKISRFLNDLARPYVDQASLEAEYGEMAADEEREAEAREWCEADLGGLDIDDDCGTAPRRRMVGGV